MTVRLRDFGKLTGLLSGSTMEPERGRPKDHLDRQGSQRIYDGHDGQRQTEVKLGKSNEDGHLPTY